MTELSLWGEQFNVEDSKSKTRNIIKKVKSAKESKSVKPLSLEQQLKSKTVSLQDKLNLIKQNVLRILGKRVEDTVVIKSKEELHNYIMTGIKNGIIGIDTETDRDQEKGTGLNPFKDNFMGFCFYTYGLKQAYVPINHTDLNGTRLSWQLTEKDVYEELELIIKSKVKTVLSNGKFDYKFIKKVGERLFGKPLELQIWWDTQIAARLLDENEKRIGLKSQYFKNIDPSQEKYSIDSLFTVPYRYVDPDIFALYAATDPYMSVKVYEWQDNQFKVQQLDKVYDLFMNVEMPIVVVTAEMELDGICLDLEYAKRLKDKYTKISEQKDKEVYDELETHREEILRWKDSSEANAKPKKEITKELYDKHSSEEDYKEIEGKYYKLGKSKADQLEDPINLESPTQLAILIYDILKCPTINLKTPRSTDKKTLPKLEKYAPFIKTFLEGKKMKTLLNGFIDKLPTLVEEDGKIHGEFNQLGNSEEGNEESVVTGRMCSSNPNLQQIPSKAKDIRMMFTAANKEYLTEYTDNYTFDRLSEVETSCGWKLASNLTEEDYLKDIEGDSMKIIKIVIQENTVIAYV